MENMNNMKGIMQIRSYCPMMTYPMMVRKPWTPNFMNYNINYNTYGAAPMRSSIANPYFFQTEMRPVPIEEIED
jgi:hypothetical protein